MHKRLIYAWHHGVTTHDIRWTKGPAIRQISGWYPSYLAVGFGRNMSVFSGFQVFFYFFFYPWPLSTDVWLIFRYIQHISFHILLNSVTYSIEIWLIFSWYPFIVPLISLIFGWYPWYLDIRFPDFQPAVAPCWALSLHLLISLAFTGTIGYSSSSPPPQRPRFLRPRNSIWLPPWLFPELQSFFSVTIQWWR